MTKDVSLKKGTSTKKKKKKSDHVSKESKKDAKEITEKKKPEKKKLPEAIRKKIRTELKDEKLPAGKYTSIYKAGGGNPVHLAGRTAAGRSAFQTDTHPSSNT